jgi:hypothetical protein
VDPRTLLQQDHLSGGTSNPFLLALTCVPAQRPTTSSSKNGEEEPWCQMGLAEWWQLLA